MSEALLSAKKASERFGLSLRTFYRYREKLIAAGLQAVRAGRRIAYREATIDRLIKDAAENGQPLYEACTRSKENSRE
ncbi:MAG TPA: hypothetical protein P5279_17455 [Anaerohalosphaeraceae bacterium]|jgi:predicted DNA-binding transcriptional regulator YafY|nr:hypothetical protein [Anaerohalosphaeraceae bacterium]HRT52280.1 hypothetical protein [Anaerohalosphaeraceae bacterium]HRT88389.1 hypothetical protein [Anaerohalosphaeraceae bacterium]